MIEDQEFAVRPMPGKLRKTVMAKETAPEVFQSPMPHFACVAAILLLAGCAGPGTNYIRVAPGKKGFVFACSGKPFAPWGHNYAVNEPDQVGEMDWPRLARDFEDFRKMRANVARVHLQVPHFMESPGKPNPAALAELSSLLKLAQGKGVFLDVTGLASYHVKHRAAWYDALGDKARWAVQARFWEAVAETCAGSSAVFCYDLVNEPIVGGPAKEGWYTGRMGDYEFLQRLTLESSDRAGGEIARDWTRLMIAAIRKHDRIHPVTIGMLPAWGIPPKSVAPELNFIAVHIYPGSGKVDDAIENLKQFDFGKPVVIEETFPLSCGVADERDFLLRSRSVAAGWIGQYPGESPGELLARRQSGKITPGQSAYLAWIELFREIGPEMLAPPPPTR